MMDAILALLAVFGLVYLGWVLFGELLAPDQPGGGGGIYAVLRAEGDGEGLEQEVNRLLWLSGRERIFQRVLLADAGLSQEGLRVAEQLAKKWPELTLCPAGELGKHLFPLP